MPFAPVHATAQFGLDLDCEALMALEYPVSIEKLPPEDGGGFLATVPLLPGCMSDGDTPEEALRNVQDAIMAWIDAARAWG